MSNEWREQETDELVMLTWAGTSRERQERDGWRSGCTVEVWNLARWERLVDAVVLNGLTLCAEDGRTVTGAELLTLVEGLRVSVGEMGGTVEVGSGEMLLRETGQE
jgi:hypothetical protein